MPKNILEWRALFLSILIAQSAGVVGSLVTFGALPLWYAKLTLPVFAPPSWVFGPVWGVLYTLMGVALYLVWKSRGGTPARARRRERGLQLFAIQLALNALWSVLFFGLQSPLYGLIGIVVLDSAVAATLFYFWSVKKSAGILMAPYLLWILFATLLNAQIYFLNLS